MCVVYHPEAEADLLRASSYFEFLFALLVFEDHHFPTTVPLITVELHVGVGPIRKHFLENRQNNVGIGFLDNATYLKTEKIME